MEKIGTIDIIDIARRAVAEHIKAEKKAPVYVLNRVTGIVGPRSVAHRMVLL